MKNLLYILPVIIIAVVSYWFGFYNAAEPNSMQVSLGFRDGTYLGYIHEVDTESSALAFDDATMLTGTAAQDAAITAGYCTETNRSECTPNDFFIKNTEVNDEMLLLDDSVLVFMQTWKMEEVGEVAVREIALNDFARLINDQSLHWQRLPYVLIIQNGKVTQIEEVYIP